MPWLEPLNIISGCSLDRRGVSLHTGGRLLTRPGIGCGSCGGPQPCGAEFGRMTTRLPIGEAGNRTRL
jgi:hypothetical protein